MLPEQERREFLSTVLPGDILLIKRHNALGAAIRAVTRSEWNHVAMFGRAADDVGIILEALSDGVAARKIDTTLLDPTLIGLQVMRPREWSAWPPDFHARHDVQAAMWAETGASYNNLVNLRILLGLPSHIPSDSFQCALAVGNAYRVVWGDVIDLAFPIPGAYDLAADWPVPEARGVLPATPGDTAARLSRVWRWLLPDLPAALTGLEPLPLAA